MKTPVSSNILVPLAITALVVVFMYMFVPPAPTKKEPYCSSCMMK